jgi:predicted glycogen debranching enzyme
VKAVLYDANACHNVSRAIQQVWQQSNDLGGFAASTILSVNTRRSHGLLVAALKPPLGHFMFLSNVDEILHIDNIAYPLSTRIYSDTICPEGYLHLNSFTVHPVPTWTYHVDDLVLEKSLVFSKGEQTVLIQYRIVSGDENLVRLELRPMTAIRHLNDLTYQNERFNTKLEHADGKISFAGLYFFHNAAILDRTGTWYRGVQYPEDQRSGLDFEEDLYSPFRLMYAFGDGRENHFCASIHDHPSVDFRKMIVSATNGPSPK